MVIQNYKDKIGKHEYLKEENYYESKTVKKGRVPKQCEFCNKIIEIGESSETHTFYPEFTAYYTHLKCTNNFKISLN